MLMASTNMTIAHRNMVEYGSIDEFADSSVNLSMNSDICEVPYMAGRRWYLVAVLGTSLSVISLFFNILIARVLLRPKHSNFFFLGLLALSDSFLSFCYGPVIAMDIIKNRFQILWLTQLWWSYVGPLLAMCHVSMTFSTFMIILGTIERYLITVKSKLLSCFRHNRTNAVMAMLFLALILRGTEIFEIKIVKNGNCTGLTEYEPIFTSLVDGWWYETVFRFYIRTIATVFIPFFLLGYLNFRIVDTLRRQKRSAAMFRFATSDHKLKIRSATRLLVLIVCSYLVANFLNVFITAWEYVDLESTQTEFTYDIYETLTDIISMLYILTCAIRFPLYILFNQEIRCAFYDFLFRPSNRVLSNAYFAAYRHPANTATNRYIFHYRQSFVGSIDESATFDTHKYTTDLSPTHTTVKSTAVDEKHGILTRLKDYCISCLCFCCLDDEKYIYDGTTSVSDLTSHRGNRGTDNRSPSTRRLSLSNCAPMGTDLDRFVVAMVLARRFTSKNVEDNYNSHDRGRRSTLPPNMLLNHCSNGNVQGNHFDQSGVQPGSTKTENKSHKYPQSFSGCLENVDENNEFNNHDIELDNNLQEVHIDTTGGIIIENLKAKRPTTLFVCNDVVNRSNNLTKQQQQQCKHISTSTLSEKKSAYPVSDYIDSNIAEMVTQNKLRQVINYSFLSPVGEQRKENSKENLTNKMQNDDKSKIKIFENPLADS